MSKKQSELSRPSNFNCIFWHYISGVNIVDSEMFSSVVISNHKRATSTPTKVLFQKLMLSDIIGNTLTTIFFNDGMWQSAIVSFQLTISNVDFSDRKKECSFLIGLLSSVIFSVMLLSSEIRVETFLYLGLVFLPAICNEMSKTYQSKISDAIDRLTATFSLGLSRMVSSLVLVAVQYFYFWFETNGKEIMSSIRTGFFEGITLFLLVSLMFLW